MASNEKVVPQPSQRVVSVDAYRGLVMFLMMAEALRLSRVAEALPDSTIWRFLAYHQTHVSWTGCSLHDLIQPGFSFLVGVALPFSIAARMAKGQTRLQLSIHAFWRALILILLGIFLRSSGRLQTNFTFEDTLTQIGLGYGFLFLMGFWSKRAQWLTLGAILAGYWLAFVLYPLPGAGFDYSLVGVPQDWPNLMSGLAAHWNKNSNLAWAVDTWFLNLFPREQPFLFNGGGYATLSFIPTLGTMILGLFAGNVLRSDRSTMAKFKWFVVAGVIGLVVGSTLEWLGICPSVKRIWTPGWTIFSGGWCFLFLAGFYGIMDLWGRKSWAFPLVVIGTNSIAAYCMAHWFERVIISSWKIHLGQKVFQVFGTAYEPFFAGVAVLLIYWLILFWMYRRKVFLKI